MCASAARIMMQTVKITQMVSTITVTGGNFDSSVAQYADSSLKFEAVTADGKQFTYHKTAEEAIAAAGSGGKISLIAGGLWL